MRAAVLTDTHGFEVAEVPDPAPGAGELLLRVDACGICGSDLKLHKSMPAGLVLGHEFCGEVVETGRDTSGRFRVGDRVAALPLMGCGACPACEAGETMHCARVDMVGVGGSWGGFAELVRVSERETFALPDSVGDGLGALAEPLAVGLHAVAVAAIPDGAPVLVIGAGPVGLAVLTWLRLLSSSEITVSDPSPERRAAAGEFGASRVVDPTAEPVGGPYPVVFECVGIPGMVEACIDAAALHGQVVIVGVCTQPDPFVPIKAVLKELRMDFVVYYRRAEFGRAVDALGRGEIDGAAIVSERIGLDGVDGAFRTLTTTKDRNKVLVLP